MYLFWLGIILSLLSLSASLILFGILLILKVEMYLGPPRYGPEPKLRHTKFTRRTIINNFLKFLFYDPCGLFMEGG